MIEKFLNLVIYFCIITISALNYFSFREVSECEYLHYLFTFLCVIYRSLLVEMSSKV